MEDSERQADRSRRDAFHAAILERPVASKPPAKPRRAPRTPSENLWYHAGWIALNVALVTAIATLYVKVLVPRLQTYWYPDTSATQTEIPAQRFGREPVNTTIGWCGIDCWSPTPTEPPNQERVRLRREQQPVSPQIAHILTAMKAGETRCIDGRLFIVKRSSASTTIDQVNGRCETVSDL